VHARSAERCDLRGSAVENRHLPVSVTWSGPLEIAGLGVRARAWRAVVPFLLRRPWPGAFRSVARLSSVRARRCGAGGPVPRLEMCLRWSAACGLSEGERSVKPSAKPSLVRTQHLPPPAETARALHICGVAGRFLLVPPCFMMCGRSAPCKGSYGRMADGTGAEPAVRVTACPAAFSIIW